MKYALTLDVHGNLCASQGLPDNRLRAATRTSPTTPC